jgi:potassium/hydrogen antiporter
MTIPIIITLCVLLLLAYVFELSSSKTRIPPIVLLLLLGWAVKEAATFFEVNIPDLSDILPILGTIGLILIVLEGSLALELNKSKLPFVGKTALMAVLPIFILSGFIGWAFQHFGNTTFKIGLANAIPLAIISSAIAIPSARNLLSKNREFVTYESSLSDIVGVIFFNFITLNDNIGTTSIGVFGRDLILMLLLTILATLGLAYLLSKIKHHVKFVPIILIILLIYTFSKIYHLPALIFILIFGLFLTNLDELKENKFIHRLHPEIMNKEIQKFRELTGEMAFIIRALFFLLFGYLIELEELLNSSTIIWAGSIVAGIFVVRLVLLKLFKLAAWPLLFIAPRGLITILLFLEIPGNQFISFANKSLIIQVIILTALVMMVGLITNKNKESEQIETSAAV